MKTINDFEKIRGVCLVVLWLLLVPGISAAQAGTPAEADSSIVPWLGVWRAVEEPVASDTRTPAGPGVLEIRPAAGGRGLEITRTGVEKPVSETIIPDGVPKTDETDACTATRTYRWERETGLLVGNSEIRCGDSAGYGLSNVKMMISPGRMADILAIKASGETRVAVRHFVLEKELDSEVFPDQARWVMRTALTAPWDIDKVIHLSKKLDTPVLQAALLEKQVQIGVDAKSLKRLKGAEVPDAVVDLLVALALPEKFEISRNGQVALVSPPSTARDYSTAYVYPGDPYYDPYGYYVPYRLYGHPWGSYWSHSPFWWGYPLYVYPVPVGGGSGGGDTPPPASGGRLSAERGYVRITPSDGAPKAVPRNGGVLRPSGNTTGRVSSGGSAVHVPSSGGGTAVAAPSSGGSGSSGASPGSGGGTNSAPTASPSGYSGGGGGGQAVPRN